jgi:hypothetical protein
MEKTNHRHRRLLRARSERPRGRRSTAKQCNELATLHGAPLRLRTTRYHIVE